MNLLNSTQLCQLLLSLIIAYTVHECGHYFFARLFGVFVQRFVVFLDVGRSLCQFKIKGTVFRLGWLPIGGYVKLDGFYDQAFLFHQKSGKGLPWQFCTKPAWQRLLIMAGGIMAGLLFALFLNTLLLYKYGEMVSPLDIHWKKDSLITTGTPNGLVNFGKRSDGYASHYITRMYLGIREDRDASVVHAPQSITIQLTPAMCRVLDRCHNLIFTPRHPIPITKIIPGSLAEIRALPKDAVIIGMELDGVEYHYQPVERSFKYTWSTQILYIIYPGRINGTVLFSIPPGKDIGVFPALRLEPPVEHKRYNFEEAALAGIFSIPKSYHQYYQACYAEHTKAELKGCFIFMARLFPADWDWRVFWQLTSLITIMLSILNLLPIPGADGGYMFFILLEMITGTQINPKLQINVSAVGFWLLIAGTLLVMAQDIWQVIQWLK
jgi:regulator of sigma E protease